MATGRQFPISGLSLLWLVSPVAWAVGGDYYWPAFTYVNGMWDPAVTQPYCRALTHEMAHTERLLVRGASYEAFLDDVKDQPKLRAMLVFRFRQDVQSGRATQDAALAGMPDDLLLETRLVETYKTEKERINDGEDFDEEVAKAYADCVKHVFGATRAWAYLKTLSPRGQETVRRRFKGDFHWEAESLSEAVAQGWGEKEYLDVMHKRDAVTLSPDFKRTLDRIFKDSEKEMRKSGVGPTR